jgi:hypothetical protein
MFAHSRPIVIDLGDGGHSNGLAKEAPNGHVNGYANGGTNGTNGYANGHSSQSRMQAVMLKPSVIEYPAIFIKCIAVVSYALSLRSFE